MWRDTLDKFTRHINTFQTALGNMQQNLSSLVTSFEERHRELCMLVQTSVLPVTPALQGIADDVGTLQAKLQILETSNLIAHENQQTRIRSLEAKIDDSTRFTNLDAKLDQILALVSKPEPIGA